MTRGTLDISRSGQDLPAIKDKSGEVAGKGSECPSCGVSDLEVQEELSM